MELFVKYVVNKTDVEVQMMDNKIKVPGKGWRGITQEELAHPDVIYAIRKDWISLEDSAPKGPASPERKKIKTINSNDPSFAGDKEPRTKVSKLGA